MGSRQIVLESFGPRPCAEHLLLHRRRTDAHHPFEGRKDDGDTPTEAPTKSLLFCLPRSLSRSSVYLSLYTTETRPRETLKWEQKEEEEEEEGPGHCPKKAVRRKGEGRIYSIARGQGVSCTSTEKC